MVKPYFTKENARAMQQRALTARAVRAEIRKQEERAERKAAVESAYGSGFRSQRLARIREQLTSVDAAIRNELEKPTPDGQQLNWLAQTSAKLSEVERQLSGRPLPGSLRPNKRATAMPDDSAGDATSDPVLSGPVMNGDAPRSSRPVPAVGLTVDGRLIGG